jgi:hypothetical protein
MLEEKGAKRGLREQLERACAFDELETRMTFEKRDGLPFSAARMQMIGASKEHARLAPLIAKLIAVAEAAEREIEADTRWNTIHDEKRINETWFIRLEQALQDGREANQAKRQALAALSAEVGE